MKRKESLEEEASRINAWELPESKQKLSLTCQGCSKAASYKVGTILIDPRWLDNRSGRLEDAVAFTAYFRCRYCDAGGPWGFPPETQLTLLALTVRHLPLPEDSPIRLGTLQLFDGTHVRYATEAEEHLKRLISADPRNAFLWSRLGNVYRSGGRKDLAKEAFRKALELDDADLESHHSLGSILFEEGDLTRSAEHMREVLKLARQRKDLDRTLVRAAVRNALEALFEMNLSTGGEIEPFPPPDPEELRASGEEATLLLKHFDLSSESSWEELVSMMLREPAEIPSIPEAPSRPRWMQRSSTGLVGAPLGPARNDPCPCKSGSKYKNCCGR